MNKVSKRIFWLCFALLVVFAATMVMAQAATPPVALPEITAISVLTIITAIASLGADYFPYLAGWYDALDDSIKRQLALAGAVVLVGVAFGLTCAGIVTSNLVCTTTGAWDAISDIIYVFAIGQGVHLGAKPTAAFKANVLKIAPTPAVAPSKAVR